MSEFRGYRDESRKNFGRGDDTAVTRDDLKFGCLLRIADGVELMAKRYGELIDERDRYKRRAEQEAAACSGLVRSNRALRGVISRMKRKKELS